LTTDWSLFTEPFGVADNWITQVDVGAKSLDSECAVRITARAVDRSFQEDRFALFANFRSDDTITAISTVFGLGNVYINKTIIDEETSLDEES